MTTFFSSCVYRQRFKLYRDKYRERMKSVSTSSSLQKQIKVEKGGKGKKYYRVHRERDVGRQSQRARDRKS